MNAKLRSVFLHLLVLVLPTLLAMADEPRTGEFYRDKVQAISSSRLSISFQSSGSGGQVTQVDAYATKNQGRTWQRFASQRPTPGLSLESHGLHSNLTYEADEDGLFGFFLVLHNVAGSSSPAPEPGTAPQQWIRVDRESPIVQILEVRPDERFDLNRELTIRWQVEDNDLPDRPVSLHFRSEETKNYRLIAESLAASSSYQWTVPEDVRGPLEIKTSAIDRAGNVGRSVTSDVSIAVSAPPAVRAENISRRLGSPLKGFPARGKAPTATDAPLSADLFPDFPGAFGHGEPDAGGRPADVKEKSEAQRKYESGTWHRLRGETELALARYQEAIDLDPRLLAARHDRACLLLVTGKPEEAEKELKKVLETEPTHRAALKSMALVKTRQQNFRSAAECLQRLLLLEPKDAEAWLYFGDVAMFMGDRAGARDAWAKAGGVDGVTEEVRRRAGERLKLYPGRSADAELASGEPEP